MRPCMPPRQRERVAGLDDQVDVVALHRVVDEAHPEPGASRQERLLDGGEDDRPPQGRKSRGDTQDDVQREAGLVLGPRTMGNLAVSARLPPGPLAATSPGRELQLSRFGAHLDSGKVRTAGGTTGIRQLTEAFWLRPMKRAGICRAANRSP